MGKELNLNTSPMYLHGTDRTQVYIITGEKGSSLAEALKNGQLSRESNQRTCILLPEKKGFCVNSWPVDPRENLFEVFAEIASTIKKLPSDRVLCGIIFGDHVDFCGD